MAPRLPIDSHLLGYWGFDEANPADVALDNSSYGNNLTVTAAPSVVPARVGNGRQFDGAATLASPASSATFRSWSDGTIIVWFTLDSVNQSGDMLRPLLCFDGPSSSHNDNTAFALFVDNQGCLVYRYDLDGPQPVIWKTAPGTIRTTRYYWLALTQALGGGYAQVSLFINNQPVSWASCTVNGVVQSNLATVPAPPTTGTTATLVIGGSNKTSSKWAGVVDELSIHDVARPQLPYLRAAYFAVTQSLSFSRLTAIGTVKTIGSVETGGGSRWWCYEREGSIYVIRENSLGLFSPEVQLTTGGTSGQGAPIPAGAEQPKLVYDAVNDVLLIIFVSGGRIFKITASGSDSPSTQNMPVTADVNTILKVKDFNEYFRSVAQAQGVDRLDVLGDNSGACGLYFLTVPTFGLAITPPAGATRVAVYRNVGGSLSYITTLNTPQTVRTFYGGYYWLPLPSDQRVLGISYSVRYYDAYGRLMQTVSTSPPDMLGQAYLTGAGNIHADADALQDGLPVSSQGVGLGYWEPIVFTPHTPIKLPAIGESFGARYLADTLAYPFFAYASYIPIKLSPSSESFTASYLGDRLGLSLTVWNKAYSV